MSNVLGRYFRLITAGESHGPAMTAIIDGCPAGLAVNQAQIQQALNRRRPGQSHWVTQRQEADEVAILSGVFEGKTTGSSITLQIKNNDAKSKDYSDLADCYRPGHADYSYQKKYGHRDYRGGGRSSARETAMWVAAGAVALQFLQQLYPLRIQAGLSMMGDLTASAFDWDSVYQNDCYWLDAAQLPASQALITQLRREGDSIGGQVSCRVTGMPTGLGDPVFHKLDAQLAMALMGVNAVKAVEIGDGVAVARQRGVEHRDEMTPDGFVSNHAGGIVGGISTGQDLVMAVSVKPPSSIRLPAQTIDDAGESRVISTKGRHDVCVAIRAVPVVEAVVALVLADAAMAQHSQSMIKKGE